MRRVPEFDALRGLAAMGVLLFHLSPNEGWTHFGMTGVHLFLVLSGYLITRIAIDHGDAPDFLRAFYARRILRIWPIYYLTLGLLLVLQHPLLEIPTLRGLPYYLTFTQFTWEWPVLRGSLTAPPPPLGAFDHSWTLALEEQFYLLWPLAIAPVRPRRLAPMALGLVGFGLWFKTLGYHSWILPNSVGAFALGGLIAAVLDDEERVARNRGGLSMAFLVASLVGFAYLRWFYKIPISEWPTSWMLWRASLQNFAFYAIHFGVVGLVATNAGARWLAPLRIRELTFLGEISYGLYLYHLPIYWLVDGRSIRTDEPWTTGLAKVAVTFVAASLSYRYIESPILRLKGWFPYDRAEPTASAIRGPRRIRARPHSFEDRVESDR